MIDHDSLIDTQLNLIYTHTHNPPLFPCPSSCNVLSSLPLPWFKFIPSVEDRVARTTFSCLSCVKQSASTHRAQLNRKYIYTISKTRLSPSSSFSYGYSASVLSVSVNAVKTWPTKHCSVSLSLIATACLFFLNRRTANQEKLVNITSNARSIWRDIKKNSQRGQQARRLEIKSKKRHAITQWPFESQLLWTVAKDNEWWWTAHGFKEL